MPRPREDPRLARYPRVRLTRPTGRSQIPRISVARVFERQSSTYFVVDGKTMSEQQFMLHIERSLKEGH